MGIALVRCVLHGLNGDIGVGISFRRQDVDCMGVDETRNAADVDASSSAAAWTGARNWLSGLVGGSTTISLSLSALSCPLSHISFSRLVTTLTCVLGSNSRWPWYDDSRLGTSISSVTTLGLNGKTPVFLNAVLMFLEVIWAAP